MKRSIHIFSIGKKFDQDKIHNFKSSFLGRKSDRHFQIDIELSSSKYLWKYINLRRYHRLVSSSVLGTKSNLDCNYTTPIDLAPSRIPFGDKSIGKG